MAGDLTPLTPNTIGINPSSCSTTGLQQNLAAASNALQNIQGQIGDLTQLFSGGSNISGNNIGDFLNSLSALLQQLTTTVGAMTGTDIYVKVNASDTANYLENQFKDNHVQASAQYATTKDLLIEFDTVDTAGDKQLRGFFDVSDQTGWTGAAEEVLGSSATGTSKYFTWGLVKCHSGDVADYLMNQFTDSAAYASGSDLLVKFDTNTANTVKLSVDSSAISGYSGAAYQMLVNNAAASSWVSLTPTSLVTDIVFDEGDCSVSVTRTNYYAKEVV